MKSEEWEGRPWFATSTRSSAPSSRVRRSTWTHRRSRSARSSASPPSGKAPPRAPRSALRLARRASARRALAWYGADSLRHRRESGHGYDLRGELDVRDEGFLRAAEALTGAPISWGNDDRAADQRRPDLPLLPADDPRGAGERLPAHLRLLARRHRARGRRRAVRARAGRRGVQRADRRRRRDEARAPSCWSGWTEAGVRVCRFRPVKAYAAKRLGNRTHRKILVADGRVGLTGGVGIAEEWTGNARGPRPLARHARARRGAGGARAVRRVRGELARGDRRGARRRRLPARPARGGGRRADDGRALQRRRRRLQHRGALLPRDRGGARDARPHRRLLRAAPGVHRGAPGRGRARRARARARAGREHRQAARLGRRAGVLRRAARGGRRALRVPADDAAREDDDRRRRVVGGRLGELRQPLVPAQRRGDAVRHVGGRSRRR